MQKKNKVLFFIFSLIPGAAHMYMGFVKRGIVIMGIFLADVGLSIFSYADVLLLLLPLMWFYSFFDAWNKYNLPVEKLEKINDDFFFFMNVLPENIKNDPRFKKFSSNGLLKGLGVVTIFLGAYMLIDKVIISYICDFIRDDFIFNVLNSISREIPQVAIAVLLIFIGVKLISNKKQQLENEKTYGVDEEDEN